MIRIVHTLGGCGGTLLSRCLGVLPDVALLSEINSGSVKLFPHFDLLYQDANWLHLLAPKDVERFSQMDLGATEKLPLPSLAVSMLNSALPQTTRPESNFKRASATNRVSAASRT